MHTHEKCTLLALLLFMLIAPTAHGGSRSDKAYTFMSLPTTSRAAALGGEHATTGVAEVGFMFHNPAVISDTLHRSFTLGVAPIAGGEVAARAAYAHHVGNIGTFALGVNYIGYGTIDSYNEIGDYLGTEHANEVAIYMTYARALTPHWQAAATLKPIFSAFAGYSSIGLAMDMGARFVSPNKRFTAGVVLCNVGGQLKTYYSDASHEELDTDLRFGMSYEAEHAPFRFTLTMKDLFHWDLSTDRQNKINEFDNILRHMIIGIELIPIRNFFLAFGYNQRMRKELRESDTGGASGISWGFGLRVSKIDISYGCGRYHKAGSDNVITISTGIDRFIKSK